ncbi:CinA family protein [Kangiella sp. TOML190]|uniref:CinA family protein n=1 Tax=Kangiella sp. TOML190 TaxID=2931351 RepID=UPI0020413BBE|nr:nicotinamide-nucleotide amidohydrolase family protein [Kangiella sp. TOML190]
MDLSSQLELNAQKLVDKGLIIVTAESCTGGMISAACTDIAGSSQWFDRAFITYSNQAKHEMLGVPMELIEAAGAVSMDVVKSMAKGAYNRAGKGKRIAIAVSGIAGPDGGSGDKPVGTVWFGFAHALGAGAHKLVFDGNRAQVRQQTVIKALELIDNLIEDF